MNPNLESQLNEELEELKNNDLERTVDDLRFIMEPITTLA